MTSIAEVESAYGDVASAVDLLDRAAELVSLTGEQWCEAEIVRLQARHSARNADETASLLEASLVKAREQGAKLWELRAAISLAEFGREQRRYFAARQKLAPVYSWFTEGLGAPDVVAARDLLDELGAHLH